MDFSGPDRPTCRSSETVVPASGQSDSGGGDGPESRTPPSVASGLDSPEDLIHSSSKLESQERHFVNTRLRDVDWKPHSPTDVCGGSHAEGQSLGLWIAKSIEMMRSAETLRDTVRCPTYPIPAQLWTARHRGLIATALMDLFPLNCCGLVTTGGLCVTTSLE